MLNLWNFLKSNILEVKILYFLEIFYFTSVLLLIMRSQPASIAWTVPSTASFCHCWSYTEHSFDKRQRYVKRMETKLEYFLDSGTSLNMLEIQKYWNNFFLERWRFAFKNTLLCIEPTQHCCIGNDIFSVCLKKLPVIFFSLLLFRNNGEFGAKENLYGSSKS